MSSHTPTRISLRRKRLNNEFRQGNPSPKRMSPSTDNENKQTEEVSHQMKNSSIKYELENRTSSLASFLTPKSCRRRREKKTVMTPTITREIQSNTSSVQESELRNMEEFSPSQSPSQFPSSQMPSTQDCEVVWDCNSPGYTREELKRMGNLSCDKTSICSPVSSAPNRLLFAKYKRPPAAPPSPLHLPSRINGKKNSDLVAAELDSLLTKVNVELIRDIENKVEEEPVTEDELSSILNSSSQVFDVSNHQNENLCKTSTSHKSLEVGDLRSNDDALSHAKDGGAIVDGLGAHSPLLSQRDHDENLKKEKEATINVSFSSLDDDDDLFNESFLRSTQALEDEILKKDARLEGQEVAWKNRVSPLSRIRKKAPVILTDQNDNSSNRNIRYNNNNRNRTCMPSYINNSNLIIDAIKKSPSSLSMPEKNIPIGSFIHDSAASKSLKSSQMMSNLCSDDTKCSNAKFLPSKQNKPRATFQLGAPSESSLSVLKETIKFASTKERNHSIDDCCLPQTPNAPQKGKFSRSKSDTAAQENLARGNSMMWNAPIQNFSQESDEDDEIFASLMPALIEVEAEHCKIVPNKGSSSSFANYANCNTKRSDVSSSQGNIIDQQKSFESRKSTNSGKISKDTDKRKNMILANVKRINKEKVEILYPGNDKSNLGLAFSNNKTGDIVASSQNLNSSSQGVSFEGRNKNVDPLRRSKANGDEFVSDDDGNDDDIFLQEGVLDYISFVESQYVSSQIPSDESASNTKNYSCFDLGQPSSIQDSSSSARAGIPLNGQVSRVQEKHRVDVSVVSDFESSRDTGSRLLKKEFLKVGEATDRLNKALKCGRSSILAPALNQPRLNDAVVEEVVSDQEFLLITSENSGILKGDVMQSTPGESVCQKGQSDFRSRGASYVRSTFQKEKPMSRPGSESAGGATNLNQNFSRLQPS